MERKNSGKCILALMMCLICTLTAILPVRAADYIDTDKAADLTVTFRPDDISASDISFGLYRIASVDEYAELALTSGFLGLSADLSDPDDSVWSSTAAAAESYISDNSIAADYTVATDENGVAEFTDLPLGLYLLRGEAFVTEDHDVYTPLPGLVMLPVRNSEGGWEYSSDCIPKYEKSDELVDVRVQKKWKGGKAEDRPDYITVILYCDDAEYETVSFSDAENWEYTWHDLSAKHSWTVSEVSVEGYTSVIEPEGYGYIITNTSDDDLPQTGVIWWHIPILAAAGVGLSLMGAAMMRKSRKADEE